MAMSVGSSDVGSEDEVNSEINAVPLVDIMLVMLIMFLITIPVVIKSVEIDLPVAQNVVTVTTPENIVIAVDQTGNFYWNDEPLANSNELFERFSEIAVQVPQPEVHIRGDTNTRFENVGKVIVQLQRASILKVGFITNPFAIQ